METVISYLSQLGELQKAVAAILGFDPILGLPVLMAVSILRSLFDMKVHAGAKKTFLTMSSLVASFAMHLLTSTGQDWQTIVKHSLVLAALVSFSYNALKGIIQWAIDRTFQRLEASTGKSYDEPENPL
jgi:uncharacterized membrane protein